MLKLGEGEEAAKKIKEIKLQKYVGETNRSIYERALEHQNAVEQMQPDSHMLKHILDKHEGEEIEEIKFGV